MPPSAEDFDRELRSLLSKAKELGFHTVEISAGNLHRRVGDYPGPDHRMPSCCAAMRKAVRRGDVELPNTLKKNGASFAIRYAIPRN